MSAADDLYASDGLSDDDLSDGWDIPHPYPDSMLWQDYVQLNREFSPHVDDAEFYEPADPEL
jgi:hypothetical protein